VKYQFFDKEKNFCDEIVVIKDVRRLAHHFYEMQYQGEDVFEHDVFEPGVYEAIEITRDPFKGQHPIELIEKTINWWESVLGEIEAAIMSS
jgi:hypothetical protein